MILITQLLVATTAAASPNETVLTSCGPVRGRLNAGTLAFKGIPFSKSPEGLLRWRPPTLPTCWDGTLDAGGFSEICAQNGGGSEDCLYLNVYTTAANASLPVLVYIHGGGLLLGDGRTDFTNFMRHGCAEGGCVIVTIQYRLGVLGWLANTALSAEQGGASGNYGLMDQQAALRWVQAEIGAFGGDRTRVTVAGQSSGGTSVFALLSSSASVGLFSAAISLSGSPNITMDLSAAEAQNAQVAAAGCPKQSEAASSAAYLACMRNASVEALLHARPPCWETPTQVCVHATKIETLATTDEAVCTSLAEHSAYHRRGVARTRPAVRTARRGWCVDHSPPPRGPARRPRRCAGHAGKCRVGE